jgi:hypothetical protein
MIFSTCTSQIAGIAGVRHCAWHEKILKIIKTTMRYHYTPIKMTMIKINDNNN